MTFLRYICIPIHIPSFSMQTRPFSLIHTISSFSNKKDQANMGGAKAASRVMVHSILTAVSSRPVGPGVTHELSPLDHAMRLHSCHLLFYYRNNPFGSFDLDTSRESLSEALCMYPGATGRLNLTGDGDWEVRCNDAGVRVLRARVSVSLDEWLRSADGVEERDLTAWEDMAEDPHIWSPFRIQLNEFEGGGIAVGVSCTHMIADLTSVTLLFKSWTDVHRGRPIEFPPVFPKSLVSTPAVTDACKKFTPYYSNKATSTTKIPAARMATSTFKFSERILKPCIEGLRREIPDVSPFDFLAALFWTSITRLKSHPENVHNHVMSMAIDYRKLVKNPLPLGYFGNSVHFSILQAMDGDLRGDLRGIVKQVHDHVSRITEEEIRAGLDWLYLQRDKSCARETIFRMYGPELMCVNMEHLVIDKGGGDASLLYNTAFNDGERPLHVSCSLKNTDGEGLIMVVPGEGFTRTVQVTLPEEEMGKLLQDRAIMELKPTLLLSGGK